MNSGSNLTHSRLKQSAALIAIGVAISATPVFAQNADDAIIVTGSRIANPNLEQSSPVSVIGAEEIALQAPTSAEQLLRDLPGTSAGINTSVNNGTNGTASFNLRGLGTNRNLVLLNSRRVVPSTLSNTVDLNIIPVALIERADVFTGGAVTSYGADAVSGVVNFVTRKDFTGLEASANYGVTERGDGETFRFDVTVGTDFADNRGNVAIGVNYTKTNPVLQGDRQIGKVSRSSTTGAPQGSGTAVPASIFFPLPATGEFAAGAKFSGDTIAPGLSDYNFNPLNLFQTPLDRWSIYGSGYYELTDNIEVYTEVLSARSRVISDLAPSGTFTNSFKVPLNNQFLTANQRSLLCTWSGLTDCAASIAAGTEVTAIIARRFVESGTRNYEYTSNVFQVTGGFRGALTSTLNFDVFGQYGEANRRNTNRGQVLAERVQQALRGCPTGSTAGCVPLNIFGAAGSITPAMLAFVGVPTNTFTNTKFSSAQAVIDGDFGVSSPWADQPVGIALGLEYRKYAGNQFGDLPSQTPGAILGSGGAFATIDGSYSSKEAFGEVNVPLVSDKPFIHDLTLEAGFRYADYTTSGGNWTYKAGGSWSPIPDVKLRGNWTRAVRAANLSELYAPVTTGLNNLAVDPCQLALPSANASTAAICTSQLQAAGLTAAKLGSIPAPIAGQINITSGGNPDLNPERATTLTFGAVVQPSFVSGLSVTLDWYRVRVNGAITSPTVSDILNGCFGQSNPSDARCQLILRNPLTGGLSGDPASTKGVILASSNLGFLETEGYDLAIAYRHELGPVKMRWSFNGNYTSKSRFQSNPSSFIRECVGFYSVSCDPALPKWSWNARVTGEYKNLDVSLLWRHLDGTSYEPRTGATATTPPAAGTVGSFGSTNPASIFADYRSISSYDYFDLNVGLDLTDSVRLSFLAENLFDKQPPNVGNTIGSTSYNSGNTFPSLYDARGRRYTMTARVRF